jgi:hypothetical protein
LVTAVALYVIILSVSAWRVVRVIGWAFDLPNRIVIQIDGQAVTRFVTEGARASLTGPDRQQQLAALEAIEEGLNTDPSIARWVHAEFAAELEALRKSPDADVSNSASRVLTSLSPTPNVPTSG